MGVPTNCIWIYMDGVGGNITVPYNLCVAWGPSQYDLGFMGGMGVKFTIGGVIWM